jgi:hypothetical protein
MTRRTHNSHFPLLFSTLLAACALSAFQGTSRVSAQDADGDITMAPRLHLRGLVTAGGQATVNLDGDDNQAEDDLVVGYGGGAEIEFPVGRYITLGGGANLTAWQADIEDDDAKRNFVIDADFTPRFRIPLGDRGRGALYLGVPVGLAINIPSDDYADAIEGLGGSLSNGVGLHVGGRVGGQVFVTERFGFVAEAGVDFRTMSHRLEGPLGGDERFMLNMVHFSGQLGILVTM